MVLPDRVLYSTKPVIKDCFIGALGLTSETANIIGIFILSQ
jgi:hypothetical protein